MRHHSYPPAKIFWAKKKKSPHPPTQSGHAAILAPSARSRVKVLGGEGEGEGEEVRGGCCRGDAATLLSPLQPDLGGREGNRRHRLEPRRRYQEGGRGGKGSRHRRPLPSGQIWERSRRHPPPPSLRPELGGRRGVIGQHAIPHAPFSRIWEGRGGEGIRAGGGATPPLLGAVGAVAIAYPLPPAESGRRDGSRRRRPLSYPLRLDLGGREGEPPPPPPLATAVTEERGKKRWEGRGGEHRGERQGEVGGEGEGLRIFDCM